MTSLTPEIYRQARLSRDARFDGRFFIAVKTTGIFCRPICPATPPKEENVEYFTSAAMAAQAGFRPCLRCRPDSAPGSWAWKGTETTLQRAIALIEQGALQTQSLAELSERLGIGDRYLRQLFQTYIGMGPKQYALFHQLMFAKQLLHSSSMTIADIAYASGFNSVRRFNDAFQKTLKLKPSDVRKGSASTETNEIQLAYRPPFNWSHMLDFYRLRMVEGIEKITNDQYERSFKLDGAQGWLRVSPASNHSLKMQFQMDDNRQLRALVAQARRMFDLDADSASIEKHLGKSPLASLMTEGIRIPGVWSSWEAGVRAVLGQQVSVKAAISQLNLLVSTLVPLQEGRRYFPSPEEVATADLNFLKMPQSRKNTLKALAQFVVDNPLAPPEDWLSIKGVGPWTVQYAQLRGLSEPDHFLNSDLIVKKILLKADDFDLAQLSPWGSYATFQCWNTHS